MKKILVLSIMLLSLVFIVSCGGDDSSCEQNEDCASGFICDESIHECVPEGATGWLEVRGNINPGEDFKLRMAIWDTKDHDLDSMVILDNFTWYEMAQKPGIAPK